MNENPQQPYRKVPAARGLAWVAGSWELFKRQPLRLLLISLFFQFFLSFSQIQAIGLLVILFLPVLSAGMLHAFMLVEHGEKPMLAPHEDSRSQDMLAAAALLEEMWPGRRRAAVQRVFNRG